MIFCGIIITMLIKIETMRNIMKPKYLLQRPSWSSNVRVIECYKIFIASIWVLYLALEIEQFKRFASPIYKLSLIHI